MLGRFGSSSSADLDHRADHHERPVGPHLRRPCRAARYRSARRSRRRSRGAGAAGLPGRPDRTGARAPWTKWARSTDEGKQWTLAWRSFFASYRLDPPVKTMSALVDQLLLELEQMRRRELELRQLVHRVEDGDVGVDVPREGQHHRRVIPGDQRTADRGDVRVEQALQRGLARILGHALREDAGRRRGRSAHPRPRGPGGKRFRCGPISTGSSQ